ncbi:hypothetical protein V8C26DRAFT_264152 [Trichoderma gracile]
MRRPFARAQTSRYPDLGHGQEGKKFTRTENKKPPRKRHSSMGNGGQGRENAFNLLLGAGKNNRELSQPIVRNTRKGRTVAAVTRKKRRGGRGRKKCVMKEKSQSRDAVRQSGRELFFFFFFFFSLLLPCPHKLVVLCCYRTGPLLDCVLVVHTLLASCSHSSSLHSLDRVARDLVRRGQGRIDDQDLRQGGAWAYCV